MSKYGEPWIVGKGIYSDMIYRSDGAAIAKAANRLKAEEYDLCNERIASCVNALNGVPHPENLPELLESVRIVMEDVTHGVLGDDTLPQVMAAVKALRRTYAALIGETP